MPGAENGLRLSRRRVPIGVIGVIYLNAILEVTADIALGSDEVQLPASVPVKATPL